MAGLPPFALLPPVSFRYATGPFIIEVGFGLLLSGVMMTQVYYYWSKYKHDEVWLKALVYPLCLLETLHTALCFHSLYSYFVLEVEDIFQVAFIVWSVGAILLIEMLVVALVQGFYIYRVWLLSRNIYVVLTQAFILFCRCAFGIATSALTYAFPTVVGFTTVRDVSVTVNFGLVLAVLVDASTSGILIFYLRQQNTPVPQTKHVIHRLMFYTVNTGAITIVFSLLTLFTFNFAHYSFTFGGFAIISTKIYANSMLAMLNSRHRIKTSNSNSIPLTTQSTNGRRRGEDTTTGHITIEITKETINDGPSSMTENNTSTVKVNESIC